MITSLKARVAALEKGRFSQPTILTMPDGSTVSLTGPGDCGLRLLGCVLDEESQTPEHKRQLKLIRESKSCNDGLIQLARALLLSPMDYSPMIPPENNEEKTA